MTTMPANPTPAEGAVVPLELLQRAHTFIEDCAFNGELQPTADSENPCELATDLAAYIAARPAAPTQSAAQTGEVETEATDLVARLNNAWVETVSPSPEGFRRSMVANVLNEAHAAIQAHATLIEAQAAEIEGLRKALEPFAKAWAQIIAWNDFGAEIDTEVSHQWGGNLATIHCADLRRAFLASRTERADG